MYQTAYGILQFSFAPTPLMQAARYWLLRHIPADLAWLMKAAIAEIYFSSVVMATRVSLW